MQENENLYLLLKKKLKVCYLTSKKDEIIIRCPYCLDSTKNAHKGHFYIQNKPPFKYFCQKCTTSGNFDLKLLSKLNVRDTDVFNIVNRSQIAYKKGLSTKYGNSIKNNKTRINYLPNQFTNLENNKIKYLENRLGIKINNKEIIKYKIILNLNDFLNNNKINFDFSKTSKKFNDLVYLANQFCIGFLSIDCSTIIFRTIDTSKTPFRYFNFSLFPDDLKSKKFYAIKQDLQLEKLEHNIILTEGIFDIIGVYNHVENLNADLFVSLNGKGLSSFLDYLSKLSILNVNIYIYSDNDVNINFYKKIMKYNRLAKYNGLNIIYNEIGKDFGVKKEEIKLSNTIGLI